MPHVGMLLFAKGHKMYVWNRFTNAMKSIRYEVKSAKENVTNAFGKITSVVWIQSLSKPSANDTGENFLRELYCF